MRERNPKKKRTWRWVLNKFFLMLIVASFLCGCPTALVGVVRALKLGALMFGVNLGIDIGNPNP